MKWKSPYEGSSWAQCQTCGKNRPSYEVWLNPRFGWQCFDCWDGLLQRDQILQPIFPGEGTRVTLAPITHTVTEGVSAGDSLLTVYDRALGWDVRYDFNFGQFITFGPSTSGNSPMGGIILNNNWILYIQNGFLNYGQVPILDAYPWPGTGSLTVDPDGYLEYVPYADLIA